MFACLFAWLFSGVCLAIGLWLVCFSCFYFTGGLLGIAGCFCYLFALFAWFLLL